MEPSMRKRGLLTWLGGALIVGGAAVLACYWWTLHEAATARQRAHEWLSRTTVEPRPAARALRRGYVIGELEIPRLHVSVAVFEGDDAGLFGLGAGHIPDTTLLPGSATIGVVATHAADFLP